MNITEKRICAECPVNKECTATPIPRGNAPINVSNQLADCFVCAFIPIAFVEREIDKRFNSNGVK